MAEDTLESQPVGNQDSSAPEKTAPGGRLLRRLEESNRQLSTQLEAEKLRLERWSAELRTWQGQLEDRARALAQQAEGLAERERRADVREAELDIRAKKLAGLEKKKEQEEIEPPWLKEATQGAKTAGTTPSHKIPPFRE